MDKSKINIHQPILICYLTKYSAASRENRWHAGGDVGGGLIIVVTETNVAVRGPDLPASGPHIHRLKGVVDELPEGSVRNPQVGLLDAAERLRQQQHLPVHVRTILLCGRHNINRRPRARKTLEEPHQCKKERWSKKPVGTSEELLDGAAEAEGNDGDALGLPGGGVQRLRCEYPLDGLWHQRLRHRVSPPPPPLLFLAAVGVKGLGMAVRPVWTNFGSARPGPSHKPGPALSYLTLA